MLKDELGCGAYDDLSFLMICGHLYTVWDVDVQTIAARKVEELPLSPHTGGDYKLGSALYFITLVFELFLTFQCLFFLISLFFHIPYPELVLCLRTEV